MERRLAEDRQQVAPSLGLSLAILVALLLFSRVLQVSWRSFPAGIALGFGISACCDLAASALMSILGDPGLKGLDLLRMGGFHVCVLVWLIYTLLPEKPPPADLLNPDQIAQWDHDLQKLVNG